MRFGSRPSLATAMEGALATAILAGLLFAAAPVRADVDVRVSIGNAPPAPHIVFRVRPHERVYPGERVYVVDDPVVGDNDCFHYGEFYWVFRDGYWYRAAQWRGPFVVVHPRYVPEVFYRMPASRWKHHPNGPPRFVMEERRVPPGLANKEYGMPPGQAKKAERERGRHVDKDRGDDHGH